MRFCPCFVVAAFRYATPLLVTGVASAGQLDVQGFVAVRSSATDAPHSWIDGGHGRLLGGGDSGFNVTNGGEARVQLDYQANERWAVRLHLGGRLDERALDGRFGVVEAFIDRQWLGSEQALQLRLGQFFLPTSLENVEPLWVSPYTLTHSALNSWIGEELRPLGVDLRWRRQLLSGNQLELGVTALRNNDASGALLAWRGFAWHDRVGLVGETLPLPELFSLSDPAIFGEQNTAGTQPFGSDLDGRMGYAARLRHGNALSGWQVSALDTQGDGRLYEGEYAWRTRTLQAGWEYNPIGDGWGYAAEWLNGTTRMGPSNGPHANIRMQTGYVLATYGTDPWRYTLRLEAFDIEDLDRSVAEQNDESGTAITLAALRSVGAWRLGIEYLWVDGERPAAAFENLPAETGGHQLKVEALFTF